jgi:hypothetical protein
MTMRNALCFLLLASGCGADRAPGPCLITLEPAVPNTGDDLVVTIDADAFDPEGDTVSYRYLWYRDHELQADYTEATLPAAATARGETWVVEVIATAGGKDGPAVEAEVSVVNAKPTVSITMDPAEPLSDEDIVAIATVEDLDGDTVQLDWSWTRDGVATSHTGDTISAADTLRWQTWEVSVVPFDGAEQGEPGTGAAIVGNAPPSVAAVTIGPEEAYEDSVFTVEAQISDLEGDVPTISYAWYVDGALVSEATEPTLGGEWFDKHQEVQVEITASDAYDTGTPVASNTVTVLNSAPTLTTVVIEPEALWESSTAICTGSDLLDADGDDLTLAYFWWVNGIEVSTDPTIDGTWFDRGDTVYCSVGADDGEVVGPTVQSDSRTVLNEPPVVPSVSISPSAPAEGDTITATVGTPTDGDGDPVTIRYAWYVDGSLVSTAEEINSAQFDKHQDIHLEVTPNDGTDDGDPTASATVTAVNTAPSFTGLATDPAEARWGSTISAAPSGWSDADGDAEGYDYAWYVDGSLVSNASSLDLTPYARGSEVYLVATANDGDDTGNTLSTAAMAIQQLLTISEADLIFEGKLGDNAGMALRLAGDLTGDGVPDIIVGAPGNNNEANDAGGVYLIAGDLTGTVEYSDAEVFLWGTEEEEEVGWSVDTLGDVDGDGWEDLIVGVPADSTYASASGAAFVVPGPISADEELGSAGIAILGTTASEQVGWSVAGAGDVDNDGYDDVLVGAYGRSSSKGAAFLAYGPFTSVHYSTTMDITMPGEATGDEAGCAVAGLGDVDGDGNDDIIVGAQAESSAGSETGAAYVLYGPIGTTYTLGYADAKLTGESDWDNAGYSVSSAGDVDGDGNDDILVGSRWEDSGGTAAGACYLITGPVTGTASLSTAQAKLIGSAANEAAGSSVAGIGDLDGDSYGELLVGAEGHASLGTNTGAAFVVLGPLTGTLALTDQAWATIQSEAVGDKLGYAVAAGRDMDGDGVPDVVLGAPYEDGNGTSSGGAFLFSGAGL